MKAIGTIFAAENGEIKFVLHGADETSIERLELSVRTKKILTDAGITTIGQTTALDMVGFLRLPGAVRKCGNELREVLAERAVPMW